MYNLLQKSGAVPKPQRTEMATIALAKIFESDSLAKRLTPFVIHLDHQYTPENFSYDGLKLNHLPKADSVLHAANKVGHYAKLCLVTSCLERAPACDGYYKFKDPEIKVQRWKKYDDRLYIDHWADDVIPEIFYI